MVLHGAGAVKEAVLGYYTAIDTLFFAFVDDRF